MLRKLDSKLTHMPTGAPRTMNHFTKSIMRQQHFALLINSRPERREPGHHLPRLSKYPWIADTSARNTYAMHAAHVNHPKDIAHSPNVAGTEHNAIRSALHQIAEKLPAPRTGVLLLHGATMHSRPHIAHLVRSFKDLFKCMRHLRRVVKRTPQLHRAGNVGWNRFANRAQYANRLFRECQEMPAARLALDLLDGACQVDINHFMPHGRKNLCATSNLIGPTAHDLPRQWMIANPRRTVVFNLSHTDLTGDEIRIFLAAPFAAIDQRAIKKRLGDTERSTMHARHQPHGAVGISCKPRLEERRVEPGDCRRNPRINAQQPRRLFNGTRKLARRNAGRVEFNAHRCPARCGCGTHCGRARHALRRFCGYYAADAPPTHEPHRLRALAGRGTSCVSALSL